MSERDNNSTTPGEVPQHCKITVASNESATPSAAPPPPKITPIPRKAALRPTPQTDVFSNFDATPMNDAAFGGAPLNRLDDFVVPNSSEVPEGLTDGTEHDFADDDFWNRTDEEDALRQATAIYPLHRGAVPSVPMKPQIPVVSP
jgi:hypothetical protein